MQMPAGSTTTHDAADGSRFHKIDAPSSAALAPSRKRANNSRPTPNVVSDSVGLDGLARAQHRGFHLRLEHAGARVEPDDVAVAQSRDRDPRQRLRA